MSFVPVDLPQAGRSLLDLCRGAAYSILFGVDRPPGADNAAEPAYFKDLNLDQVADRLADNGDQHTLAPLFRFVPDGPGIARLRQGVFLELRRPEVRQLCEEFSSQMRHALACEATVATMRETVHAQRWHLRAAEAYCAAVSGLLGALSEAVPASKALHEIVSMLKVYRASAPFDGLEQHAAGLQDRMRKVRYDVFTAADRVTVGSYANERAWEQEIVDTFARFRPGHERPPAPEPRPAQPSHYDPVRERIVEQVVKLQPAVFDDAARFCARYPSFFDPTVVLLYRELQFYLSYLNLIEPLEKGGLSMTVSPDLDTENLFATGTYDIALGLAMSAEKRVEAVVTNDVEMMREERLLVVTGPNQGGKTTMARTIGQLHHLARLGCPVPGSLVQIPLPDDIFTHFDRAEVVSTQGSKLEEDLRRVASILGAATWRSLVILNETFSSTTSQDARELGEAVLHRLTDIGCRCLYVTFIDELSRFDEHTLSMTSTVEPDDPAHRTLKVVPQRADGRAYAASLAAKYRLSHDDLRERIGS